MTKRACGHEDCGVSSALDDTLTFGRGALDFNGFWEQGCYKCARAFELAHPDMAAEYGVWPTSECIHGAPRVITDGVAITPANIDDATVGKQAGMVSSGPSNSGFFPFV